jgi:hypothetical protein
METERLLWLGAGALVCVLAGVFLVRLRPRTRNKVYLARCPHCDQKIRYSAVRAGHDAPCPHCKRHWVFPVAPVDPKTSGSKAAFKVRRK